MDGQSRILTNIRMEDMKHLLGISLESDTIPYQTGDARRYIQIPVALENRILENTPAITGRKRKQA